MTVVTASGTQYAWNAKNAVIPIVMKNVLAANALCVFVCRVGGGNTGIGTITCLSDKGGLGRSARHMGHVVT